MARDRQSYEAVLAAVGVCVSARIPFLLWGDPGAGKTAVVEGFALRDRGARVGVIPDASSAHVFDRAAGGRRLG